jgi:hypothetical protein
MLVDNFGSQIGVMANSWKDYVKIFVAAFLNGISQLILSLAQLAIFAVEIFKKIVSAAGKMAMAIASAIKAGITGGSFKDTFKKEFSVIVADIVNPNSYNLTAKVQGLKDVISEKTLGYAQSLSDEPAKTETTITNNTFVITLDEAMRTGQITSEQADVLRGLGVTGI